MSERRESLSRCNFNIPKDSRYYFHRTERYLRTFHTLEHTLGKTIEKMQQLALEDPDDQFSLEALRQHEAGQGARDRQRIELDKRTSRLQARILRIKDALESVAMLPGYDAILLHYIEGVTVEAATKQLNIGRTTFYRYRDRLIRDIAIELFDVDAMDED